MSGAAAPVVSTGGLGMLVDAEARLDREIATAHVRADAMRAAARQRASEAAAALDGELVRERERAIAAIEAATARELRTIAEQARIDVARFEAIDVQALARVVVDRLAELVLAEAAP
jgi:hypothetical protein